MNEASSVTVVGFEGPEKRLEVDFKKNLSRPNGLRDYSRDQWQEFLNLAQCTIISHTYNEHFDAYVLSESSLFVYPYKIMVKTCGTTKLLLTIPKLLEFAREMDLEMEMVMYSRKNFLFPEVQVFPHNDWKNETDYLDQYFDGVSYVLGPLTQHHWYLYLADYSTTVESSKDLTLEVMMHNLDRRAAMNFYRKEDSSDRDKFPGVAELIPGQETDEFNFSPCGYSMNGLWNNVYSTIHVTPEPHCSYASFETNLSLSSYKSLLQHVFDIFKPGTVTLILFSERANSRPGEYAEDLDIPGYTLKHKSVSELGSNRDVVLCALESNDLSRVHQKKRVSLTRN